MLFNSTEFIFVFLPVVLVGFYLIGRYALYRLALCWLLLASLLFYGYWNPRYLLLLGSSVVINYVFGTLVNPASTRWPRKTMLVLGLSFNIGLLGYFKYAGFLVDTANTLAGTGFPVPSIVLPLAISFFSFQQIAYLVDVYQGKAEEYSFLQYCLFISFFPQLIAGPIVHHKEMMPQFADPKTFVFDSSRIAVGLSIFSIGLFKKVVLADSVVELTRGVYTAAERGASIEFLEAWLATLGYTCQIYFDFSGYSDMAIGLGWMFGIMLPLNFSSPLRATSMIELWATWHMTLSRFLRDYLFLPLGGNSRKLSRRGFNLMFVMLVGGLWHGSNWTFVLWGGMQGLYLIINHYWRTLMRGRKTRSNGLLWVYRIITFMAFVLGVVLFRSDSFVSVNGMFYAMFGGNGFALPVWLADVPVVGSMVTSTGAVFTDMQMVSQQTVSIVVLLVAALWVAPNTQQIMRNAMGSSYRIRPPQNLSRHFVWRASRSWGAVIGLALFVSVISLWETSEFIYYQF